MQHARPQNLVFRSPNAARNPSMPPAPHNSPQALAGTENPYGSFVAPRADKYVPLPTAGQPAWAQGAPSPHRGGAAQPPWAAAASAPSPSIPLSQLPPTWLNCSPPPGAQANGHPAHSPKTPQGQALPGGSSLGLSGMEVPSNAWQQPSNAGRARLASERSGPPSPEAQQDLPQAKRQKVHP